MATNEYEPRQSGPLGAVEANSLSIDIPVDALDHSSVKEQQGSSGLTFDQFITQLGATNARPNNRMHLHVNISLLHAAFPEKSSNKIHGLYTNIAPFWENLKKVDHPQNPYAIRLKEEGLKDASEDERQRMNVIREMGQYATMAAHSERVGYGTALLMANFIFLLKSSPEKITGKSYQSLAEEFKTYVFSKSDLQIIANAGLAALMHDVGKGHYAGKKQRKNLQELYSSIEANTPMQLFADIVNSSKIRSYEQKERMGLHTRYGRNLLHKADFNPTHKYVAKNHHKDKFTNPYRITIKHIENGKNIFKKLLTLSTVINDGFDAGSMVRTYAWNKRIIEFLDDERIMQYLTQFNDERLFAAYHMFILEMHEMAGEKLEHFKEAVLKKTAPTIVYASHQHSTQPVLH